MRISDWSSDVCSSDLAALYRRAVQIVAESQKASTSYLQRQLRVGYNNAARLIERMEKDGLVGQADHVGRREMLIDTDGHPIQPLLLWGSVVRLFDARHVALGEERSEDGRVGREGSSRGGFR